MIDDEIVSVDISAASATPTRMGFGTPMFMVHHTENTDLFRTYKSLSSLTADGFTSDSAAYKMLAKALSQSPRPKNGVKIGRITTAVAHTVGLTMLSAVEGAHVKLTIKDEDGNSTDIDYTILSSATTTTVATAVELLVEAVTGIASTSSGAVITAVGTSGKMFWYEGLTNVALEETTPSASIDDDLAAIQAIDDDWYGVAIPYGGATNIGEVAAWIETQKKVFIAQTADYDELTSGGTLGAGLKALSYKNTALVFDYEMKDMISAGLIANLLPRDPGSYTAMFKSVVGATADPLNATQIGFLDGDNINHYTSAYTGGIPMIRKGKMVGGRFIDQTIFLHWLEARIKEAVFGTLAAAPKVDYDNDGLASIGAKVLGVLKNGVKAKGLRKDPAPTVFVPDVDDIDEGDRADRLATGITFDAKEAGAIHGARIAGSVTV